MFNKKSILITGGTGSWGNELTKQILERYNPKEIRIYSRGEHKQVEMKIKNYRESRLKFIIGDVRDQSRLNLAMKNVDYVFHLAALKHVPVCEENPWESVLTNINGTRNVIEAAIENKVKKVIDISTDKAVDPFNLYGICKSAGERLMIAANLESDKTSFVCIRAGNVLGTNGSVVPLFKNQISENNEITITDEKMTRYFLSIEDAIGLIFKATEDSVGGETFVMKMPSARIIDMARVMINHLGDENTKIRNIGIRPGEKLYEVLVSRFEAPRCIEDGNYYIVLPSLNIKKIKDRYDGSEFVKMVEFNSENTHIMSSSEISEMLKRDGWISKDKNNGSYYGKKMSKEELGSVFKREGWQSG
jgi:FlaA1/EpsC-like NDP-sugar epimerase